MIYNDYPYNIYNPEYINFTYLQQLEAQQRQMQAEHKHWEQQKKVEAMVKAISDYCNAARELEPAYQQPAMVACLIEIARQMNIDEQKKR